MRTYDLNEGSNYLSSVPFCKTMRCCGESPGKHCMMAQDVWCGLGAHTMQDPRERGGL